MDVHAFSIFVCKHNKKCKKEIRKMQNLCFRFELSYLLHLKALKAEHIIILDEHIQAAILCICTQE